MPESLRLRGIREALSGVPRKATFRSVPVGLLVVVLELGMVGCSNVAFIKHITIVNETSYAAEVDVTSASHDGWLGLGVTGPDEVRGFEEVIDQGDQWIFRFDYAGLHQEEIEISRSELENSDWRVEVPASFEQSLLQLGVPPPP